MQNSKGHTLVELLVSLVIGSLLLLGAFSAFTANQLQQKQRVAQQTLLSTALSTQAIIEQSVQNALAGFHSAGRPLCDKLWSARNSGLISDDQLPFYPIKLSTEPDASGILKAQSPSINIATIVAPNPAPISLSATATLAQATIPSYAPLSVGDEIILAQATNPSTCTSRIITNITKNPDLSYTLAFDNTPSTTQITTSTSVTRSPSVSSYPPGSLLIPVKSIITHEFGMRNAYVAQNTTTPVLTSILYDRLTYYPNLGSRPVLDLAYPIAAFSYKTYLKSSKTWANPGDTINPYDVGAIRFSISFYSYDFYNKGSKCSQSPKLFGAPLATNPTTLSNASCRIYYNSDFTLPLLNAP